MDSSYGQTGPQYSLPQNSDAAYVENGLHPVPADQTDKIINSAHYVPYDQYKPVSLSPDQGMKTSSLMPKKRICGVGRGMFILFCVLAFFIVVLVVIAGLFGAMLANQSVEILDLKNTTPTKTTQPETNATSTETSTAAAATTTWVEVNDWEFIGCWMDGDERIFPDKNVVIKNQTNRLPLRAPVTSTSELSSGISAIVPRRRQRRQRPRGTAICTVPARRTRKSAGATTS